MPPLGNEFNLMMKSTSLLSVIGLQEMFLTAQAINSATFKTFALVFAIATPVTRPQAAMPNEMPTMSRAPWRNSGWRQTGSGAERLLIGRLSYAQPPIPASRGA